CRPAVRLINEANPCLTEAKLRSKHPRLDDRLVEIRLREGVAEPSLQLFEHVSARMEWNRPLHCLRHRPQLIDSVAMIPVRMGYDHAGEAVHLHGEQLLAQVRPAIDEHSLTGAFDEDRGPQPIVSRLPGIALAPFVADLRNARRRPTTQDAN